MVVQNTTSLCPICLKRLSAVYKQEGRTVYLVKECSEHGQFSTVVWRGSPERTTWCEFASEGDENEHCPELCGLCQFHLRKTCCAILNVSNKCNLKCNYCFAGDLSFHDPSLDYIKHCLQDLASKGITFVHLSGGEPTLREDIPEIVEYAVSLGFEYIQLNTNGIRLAQEGNYAQKIADAGVSVVFLQFDGVDDSVYSEMRGKPLFYEKCRAIEQCDKAHLGVILVPTIVPGINDQKIGDIVKFGISKAPSVKGIHFQPVTYVGRFPYSPNNSSRITLPEVLLAIEKQTDKLIKAEQFSPSCCDHPMCGFHAEFIYEEGSIKPFFRTHMNKNNSNTLVNAENVVRKNQNYVRLRWARTINSCAFDPNSSIDAFLNKTCTNSFSISGMAFQDEHNVDLNRLRHCSVHVYEDGKLIPFCANYIYHNRSELNKI